MSITCTWTFLSSHRSLDKRGIRKNYDRIARGLLCLYEKRVFFLGIFVDLTSERGGVLTCKGFLCLIESRKFSWKKTSLFLIHSPRWSFLSSLFWFRVRAFRISLVGYFFPTFPFLLRPSKPGWSPRLLSFLFFRPSINYYSLKTFFLSNCFFLA